MAYELMADNTPIAIREGGLYYLLPNIHPSYVSLGMFKDGKKQKTF